MLHEPAPWRTKVEAALIRLVIRERGQGYADAWAEQILQRARAFGDLAPDPPLTSH